MLTHVLCVQVGDAGSDVAFVASSCQGFFSWLCSVSPMLKTLCSVPVQPGSLLTPCHPRLQRFGGDPSENSDCEFYCEYVRRAAHAEIATTCASHADCELREFSTVTLDPAPGTLCRPSAKYAIFMSCNVPDSRRAPFVEAVDEFLVTATPTCESVRSRAHSRNPRCTATHQIAP